MNIGHINLCESFNGTGEHFVSLIEALQRHGISQYVVVRNVALAKRLDLLDNVTVGPVVRTSVTASCLMPKVDVVHVHNASARQAGLLLSLTRSIPFVMTHRSNCLLSRNPFTQAIYKRASGIICTDAPLADAVAEFEPSTRVHVIADICREGDDGKHAGNIAAAAHLQVYRRAAESWQLPTLLL